MAHSDQNAARATSHRSSSSSSSASCNESLVTNSDIKSSAAATSVSAARSVARLPSPTPYAETNKMVAAVDSAHALFSASGLPSDDSDILSRPMSLALSSLGSSMKQDHPIGDGVVAVVSAQDDGGSKRGRRTLIPSPSCNSSSSHYRRSNSQNNNLLLPVIVMSLCWIILSAGNVAAAAATTTTPAATTTLAPFVDDNNNVTTTTATTNTTTTTTTTVGGGMKVIEDDSSNNSIPSCPTISNRGQCQKYTEYCIWDFSNWSCLSTTRSDVTVTHLPVTSTSPPTEATSRFGTISPKPTYAPTLSPSSGGGGDGGGGGGGGTKLVTESPTIQSTPNPTTSNPTPKPPTSPPPTPKPPTSPPTMEPTTKKPTTEEPTMKPIVDVISTEEPTDMPSLETNDPTLDPTRKPTKFPTRSPTPNPTNLSTPQPTPKPTPFPSLSPTRSPTARPSVSPTASPSDFPSKNPTISPKPTPLVWPSSPPTQSLLPTVSPSNKPTDIPTNEPSPVPTMSPLAEGKTRSPTSSPVPSSPSLQRVLIGNEFTAITLKNANKMSGTAEEAWEEITKQRIVKYSQELIADTTGEKDVNVKVTITDLVQRGQDGQRRRRRRRRGLGGVVVGGGGDAEEDSIDGSERRRVLQDDSPLRLSFSTSLEFYSKQSEWDGTALIASGFITLSQQNEYIADLKKEDPNSFGNVRSMTMSVNSKVITDPTEENNNTIAKSNTWTYIIAGAVAGVLVLFALGGGVYYVRRRNRRRNAGFVNKNSSGILGKYPEKKASSNFYNGSGNSGTMMSSPPSKSFPPSPPSPQQEQSASPMMDYFGTIEPRHGDDDVSTLGDPYIGDVHVNLAMGGDNTVTESLMSSGNDMYVYGVSRPRMNTGDSSRMEASTINGNRMTFQDDGTIEEFYGQPDRTNFHSEKDSNFEHITVVAQSGVLGIVIDNPTRNIPIIHAIKETSILHGRVHVGDYLMSVDEVDCRGMTAVAVSKLIGSRSSNPTRTLKLLRGATLADVRGDSSAIY